MEDAQVFDLSQYISSFVSAQEQNILEFYFVFSNNTTFITESKIMES